mmetsp:Transcript_26894/g.58772  ORF Transcript_26894/g.58772 Transcript_26894/m.58772 type:complete len:101 (-) Transcript_26894:106-408(-)
MAFGEGTRLPRSREREPPLTTRLRAGAVPAPPVPPSSSGEEAEACQVVGLPPPKVLGRTDPTEFEDLWGLAAVATVVAAAPAPGDVVVVAVAVAVAVTCL